MAPGILNTIFESVPVTVVESKPLQPSSDGPEVSRDQPKHYEAVVIGAGWAGLWTLYRLRQRGFNAVIFEAHEDVGGVWLYTKYPGCRNETETPVYQFSAKETWETWNWKERFPAQEDVHAYMRHTAKVLGLRPHMIFNTRLSKAEWIEDKKHWALHANGHIVATTTYFIPCTGYAGEKYIPEIKGLSTFTHAYHTSEWPEALSVKGKSVGVIGTGSSGMQTIEAIGPKVGHLTVFQRTPNMSNPRHQQQLTAESEAEEHKQYTRRFQDMQNTPTGLEIYPLTRNTFDDTSEERLAAYEKLWAKGAQHFWFGNYKDMLTNKQANDEAYAFWRNKTRPRIRDPVKRELLAPLKAPHAFGTKRPSLESSYFEVYNQSNVDLVDLKTDSIQEVTSRGVHMASGAFYELDIIVLATGYDFGIGSQLAIHTLGVDGISLREKWSVGSDAGSSPSTTTPTSADRTTPKGNNIHTYLGIMTAGFPNMLFPAGPQAPTAFGITPRLAELQGDWLADLMVYLHAHGHRTIDTTTAAEQGWKAKNLAAAHKTLIPATDGWYNGNNIPGRAKEPLFWFGGVPEYMDCCEASAKKGYEGFVLN